jgi:cold shock CspA family protein
MGRSQDSFKKKDVRSKQDKKKKDKEKKRLERKSNAKDGNSLDDMIAYVDEYGNITSTPPDPTKREKINAEDIAVSIPKRVAEENVDPVRRGTVTFFNDSKGFGFIRDSENQQSIFVHINSVIDRIKENDKVSFEVEMGPKGPNAVRVTLVK